VGTKIEGKVKSITDFGVFVGLEEGIDGLIHISDISWTKRISHPSELFKKGQNVEAIVLKIDREKERISLGYKQLTPDPWEKEIPEKYKVGQQVQGKVVRVTDFGVFVELEDGMEGLIHVSELGLDPSTKMEEIFKIHDEVTAKITRVDPSERKIALSVRKHTTSSVKKDHALGKEPGPLPSKDERPPGE
jgi:small subunit ribosomal protein S1